MRLSCISLFLCLSAAQVPSRRSLSDDLNYAVLLFGGQTGTTSMTHGFRRCHQIQYLEASDEVFLHDVLRLHEQAGHTNWGSQVGSKKWLLTKTQNRSIINLLPLDTAVIHITRSNFVKWSISHILKRKFLANEGYFTCRLHDNCSAPTPPTCFDPESVFHGADIKRLREAEREHHISRRNFPYLLRIEYEASLVQGGSNYAVGKIFDFLNITCPVGPLPPKQTSDELKNVILNYDEVYNYAKAHQNYSQYMRFFPSPATR